MFDDKCFVLQHSDVCVMLPVAPDIAEGWVYAHETAVAEEFKVWFSLYVGSTEYDRYWVD